MDLKWHLACALTGISSVIRMFCLNACKLPFKLACVLPGRLTLEFQKVLSLIIYHCLLLMFSILMLASSRFVPLSIFVSAQFKKKKKLLAASILFNQLVTIWVKPFQDTLSPQIIHNWFSGDLCSPRFNDPEARVLSYHLVAKKLWQIFLSHQHFACVNESNDYLFQGLGKWRRFKMSIDSLCSVLYLHWRPILPLHC